MPHVPHTYQHGPTCPHAPTLPIQAVILFGSAVFLLTVIFMVTIIFTAVSVGNVYRHVRALLVTAPPHPTAGAPAAQQGPTEA
jgi:hypothetical protein